MFESNLRGCLLSISFTLLVVSCSHFAVQPKQQESASPMVPNCQGNQTKHGGILTAPTYKTWVRYDRLDSKKGFDLAVKTLQTQGHHIISSERAAGRITVDMVFGNGRKKPYRALVQIHDELSSCILTLSLKGERGGASPDLCSFYDEFGRLVRRSYPAPKKQSLTSLSSQKPHEEQKPPALPSSSSAPPSPTPLPSSSPSAAPAPSPPHPSPLVSTQVDSPSKGKVVWAKVNFREGPGLHYRVIGKAVKGNSLEIHEERNGWLRIRLEDGRDGWITKEAVSEDLEKSSTSNVSVPKVEPSKPKEQKPKSPM